MSVLALVTDAFGGHGGIAQYNRDLLSAWSQVAKVTVLPRGGTTEGVPSDARLRQAPPVRNRVGYTLAALRLALSIRPQVVFCGHLYMAPLAWAAARLSGAKLIVQAHGIDAWASPGTWRRKAVERADLVLSVSRYTRSRLLSWAALSPQRVKVLPNTVDGRFAPGDRMAARNRFGLRSETVVLSVGRLDARERYKGQDRVIAALPRLRDRHPGLVYCIAGEGDDRARLEGLAREAGVSACVRFLGGVPDADLPDLYRAADLFALPSMGEGFGIVFLEAMACGTPALGLAEAGAVDALADGMLGHACAEADLASALLAALGDAARDEAARNDLSRRVHRLFGATPFRAHANELLRAQTS